MANNNVFQKGEKFAGTALELLKREVKLLGLFSHTFTAADFQGAAGDTVNVKRPAILVARDKGWRNLNPIVVDTLNQSKIAVKLDQHPYSAVQITAEERTLDDVDYIRDVQAPQVAALVDYLETAVVKPLRDATYKLTVKFDQNSKNSKESDPRKVALAARKLFQDAHVPTGDRYWIVGSSVAEAIAGTDELLAVDTSGLPEALRDGVVGKLAGFIIIEADALGENESYFIHGTAVAPAVVAPERPVAAKGGGVAVGQGLAVTQIWDYDGLLLTDRSVVHAFAGAGIVTDPVLNADGTVKTDAKGEVVTEYTRAIKVTFTPLTVAA